MINLETEATIARYLEYMMHNFYNGLSNLAQLEGLSDEEMDTVYADGYNYFIMGMYEEAKEIFQRLTAYAPYTGYFWRALAATYQVIKEYPEAIDAYNMAIENDEADIVSYVYRAESHIISGNISAGVGDLEKAITFGAGIPAQSPFVKRAERLLRIHKDT
jgi:tetratricopeptide (TPR) repeat protein